MNRTKSGALALATALTLLMAVSVSAATFVVPSDTELARKAKAIALGTVLEVVSVETPEGGIETVTTVRVDDVLKGNLKKLEALEVTELGGVVGDRALIIPGVPIYQPGEQVIIFLERNRRGGWSTAELALGKFEFVAQRNGGRGLIRRELLSERATTPRGTVHRESIRDEQKFLNFLKKVGRDEDAPEDYLMQSAPLPRKEPRFLVAASSSEVLEALWRGDIGPEEFSLVQTTTYPPSAFLMTVSGSNLPTRPIRWSRFDGATPQSVGFRNRGTQAGMTDSVGALQRALASWTNDAASTVSYTYAGTTTASSGFLTSDNIHSVQFNDPAGEIAGSWTGAGTVAIGGYWVTGTTNSFKGQTFYTIYEADVVVQNGLTLTSAKFDEALTHELGHTLGFRHSNTGTAPGTTAAVMNSTLSGVYGTNLQSWDRSAVQTVYGSGAIATQPAPAPAPAPTPTCTAPTISNQSTTARATVGTAVPISVTASGTSTLVYTWYEGLVGNTSAKLISGSYPSVRAGSSTARTRYFWVEVSNGCGRARSQQISVTWY